VNSASARVQTRRDSLSTHSLFFAPFHNNLTIVPSAKPPKDAKIVSSMIPVTKNSLAGCLEVMIANGRSQYGVPIPSLIPDSSYLSASSHPGSASLQGGGLEYRVGRVALHQLGFSGQEE
jgi:hypothetical protein